MARPTAAVLMLPLLALGAPQLQAGDPVQEARALLAADDPRGAVRRLEDALSEVDRARLPELLEALRDSYARAIARAETEGKASEAAGYREGLTLLPGPKPGAVEPPPVPSPVAEPPTSLPAPSSPAPEPREPTPEPRAERAEPAAAEGLAVADRAWKERRYPEAGAHYAALARLKQLPPGRRDHWAYCRLVVVLDRINAGPRTPAEWAEIHAEIDHIRLLSPKNWYSEYLRNVVVERSGGVRKGDPGKLILRGAAPDDGPPPTAPSPLRARTGPIRRSTPAPAAPQPPPEPRPLPRPSEAGIGRPGPPQGRWKTLVTPNFRIFYEDEALARKVAARAEQTRREAARRWTGAEPRDPWSPRCDVYLYPTAAIFAAETRQPRESPGFSTAGLGGGRVTARLVKLRADYPKMLEAVLPHEVTHIVLADLFCTEQIPRWADEGMAVLSEPEPEQALRARDLSEPLSRDVLFRLDVLMRTDYPKGSHWALFYAQSVSVTRYLVGLGTPPQFAQFVRKTQTRGVDVALRESYGIDGTTDLQRRWKAHALGAANPATASAAADGDEDEVRLR